MRKKKQYTIFFSWQSDTKRKETEIIEQALNQAVQSLEHNYGYKIIIDHSTLGDSGMPNITQTIMRKIDECDIFLCDLTPIQKFEKDAVGGKIITKQLPNPNVLVELGYAMSAVGIDYIIPLAHKGDWLDFEMPFDINHNKIIGFSRESCNLAPFINAVIDTIKKKGAHRHLDEPYLLHKTRIWFGKIKNYFVEEKSPSSIHLDSTSFFTRRMGMAFPGDRGLVTYTRDRDIRRCLNQLLAAPLHFDNAVGYEVHSDPIWWSRGVCSLDIPNYKRLGFRRYLIGFDEVKIKRIVAYVNYAKYYSEYVYIETLPDKPTGLYFYTEEQKQYFEKELKWDEEFAIYKLWGIIPIKITRQEYDDGYKVILGKTVHVGGKSELRTRYLKPYNFIISAKKSAYYNRKFEMTSEEVFDGMLRGEISVEEFNEYMMQFPKPLD